MEALMIVLIFATLAVGLGVLVAKTQKKRKAERDAKEAAEAARTARYAEDWQRFDRTLTKRRTVTPAFRNTGTAYPPQPSQTTVVREDNTGSLLMAGAVGYMLASSGNSHARTAQSDEITPTPAAPFSGLGGESGGAGASASWGSCEPERDIGGGSSNYDSGSSSSDSSYSSSDSGSSYSSSDSGGGSSSSSD